MEGHLPLDLDAVRKDGHRVAILPQESTPRALATYSSTTRKGHACRGHMHSFIHTASLRAPEPVAAQRFAEEVHTCEHKQLF